MEPIEHVQHPRRGRWLALGLLLPVSLAALINFLSLRLGEPLWLGVLTGAAMIAMNPATPVAIFHGLSSIAGHNGTDFPLFGRLISTAALRG